MGIFDFLFGSSPSGAVPTSGKPGTAAGTPSNSGEKQEQPALRDSLALFGGPAMAQVLVGGPEALTAQPVKREITILALDLPGFLESSVAWDSQTLAGFFGGFLDLVTRHVNGCDGNLDSFQQGRLMALFGFPVTAPQGALLGLRCAIDLREALVRRCSSPVPGKPAWPMPRLALHHGYGAVGPFGCQTFMTFSGFGGDVSRTFLLLERGRPGDLLVSAAVLGSHADWFDLKAEGSLPHGSDQCFRLKGPRDPAAWSRLAPVPAPRQSQIPPGLPGGAGIPMSPGSGTLTCANCETVVPKAEKTCPKCGLPVF